VDRSTSNASDSGDCRDASAPCLTIGYAVDQAGVVTTIAIAPGTYCEHLVVDQSMTLTVADSENPPVLDGGADGRCNGETPGTPDGADLVGNNVVGDTDGANGDQVVASPLLDDLQNNGGTVPTMAPLDGSLAIDAGDASTCLLSVLADGATGDNDTDARGDGRSADARATCDAGRLR
jgi:hypothetical protein